MDRHLLFLAKYPNTEELKDGMYQRIYAVDKHFTHINRQYLHISYKRYFKKEVLRKEDNLTTYNCNIFCHFFLILRLISKCYGIYFHSVYTVLNALPVLILTRNKAKLVLDVHGIVPEEEKLRGKRLIALLSTIAEKYIMMRVHTSIVVTHAMQKHLQDKYPNATCNYLVYTILPHHIASHAYVIDNLSNSTGNLSILYSGNTQEWQNINLMIDVISNNIGIAANYVILTGEPDKMKQRLSQRKIERNPCITMLSVSPEDLKDYYRAAHYGFILRDDIAVNRVACPTKLVEYLYYGIIPIVKSADIGDFNELGYEYIHYSAFNIELPKRKSYHNQQIAKQLLEKNAAADLSALFA